MKSHFLLTQRAEFLRLARRGNTTTQNGWKMTYLANHRAVARIGINLSKKMVRRACRRNRLRRVLREQFRQQWRSTLPPVDVLFQLLTPFKPPLTEEASINTCATLLSDIKLPMPRSRSRAGSRSSNRTKSSK